MYEAINGPHFDEEHARYAVEGMEREMQNKIDTLRDEKNALQSSALLQQQTSNIVSQIRPCPVPAYLTCNPYGCNGGLNGYGYGYPYGYGDSCCA